MFILSKHVVVANGYLHRWIGKDILSKFSIFHALKIEFIFENLILENWVKYPAFPILSNNVAGLPQLLLFEQEPVIFFK